MDVENGGDSYAFIGVVGKTEALEKRSGDGAVSVAQIFHLNGQTPEKKWRIQEMVPTTQTMVKKDSGYYLGHEEQADDTCTMFLKWCTSEGIITPKLEYPAHFQNGLVGVRCREEILNREAFLYVPYKMMFTVSKVQNHPILGPIVKDNPSLFEHYDQSIGPVWEVMTLLMGIFYEIAQGPKSYWYPWIRQMLDIPTPCIWKDHELEMLEDDNCLYNIIKLNDCLDYIWFAFVKVLE